MPLNVHSHWRASVSKLQCYSLTEFGKLVSDLDTRYLPSKTSIAGKFLKLDRQYVDIHYCTVIKKWNQLGKVIKLTRKYKMKLA